jgi:hypothetical protein
MVNEYWVMPALAYDVADSFTMMGTSPRREAGDGHISPPPGNV